MGNLRERVQLLTAERDSLQAQLKDAKMDMRCVLHVVGCRAAGVLQQQFVHEVQSGCSRLQVFGYARRSCSEMQPSLLSNSFAR